MANFYVNYGNGTSTGYYAVAQWQASHAYTVGQIIRQLATPTVGNERCFRCSTAGTSAATEPTWTLTKNATTTSGTAVFTECTGQEAYQGTGSTAWTAPAARLQIAATLATTGDTIYIASNHAETQAAAMTVNLSGTFLCVTQTAVPPTDANLTTGATIATTGANAIAINGSIYGYGLTINVGSGAVTSGLTLASSASNMQVWDTCAFAKLGTTTNSAAFIFGSGSFADAVEFRNTTLQFGATADAIQAQNCLFTWLNTPNAIAGSVFPNGLFSFFRSAVLRGVDLSALGSGKVIWPNYTLGGAGYGLMENCKLNSAVTVFPATGYSPNVRVDLINCDSGATNYRNERTTYTGALTTDIVVARSNGFSDGTTPQAHKVTPTSNNSWRWPFEAFPIKLWNDTSGVAKTFTVEGLWNGSALPNNDDVWIDVEYAGSSATPQQSIVSGSKASFLATAAAQTASTEAWDGQTTARANSHAYAVGDLINVASNPGRVFICTVAGTSSSSEPAGYATAIDGGAVTDGLATFRALVRFKMAVTVTPQMKGVVSVLPKVAHASNTIWIDPLVTVS